MIPLIRHKFDRGAVAAATTEISSYVSAACADARLAHGGVHVLVLVDTFACPGVVPRAAAPAPCHKPRTMMMPPSGALMKTLVATKTTAPVPCIGVVMNSGVPPARETTARSSSGGVIGDARANKPVEEEERFKGWLPW